MNTLKIWSSNTEGAPAFSYLELEFDSPLAPDGQLFFLDSPAGSYTFEVPGVEPGARAFRLGSPSTPSSLSTGVSRTASPGCPLALNLRGIGLDRQTPEATCSRRLSSARPGRIVGTGLEGDVIVLLPDGLMEYASAIEALYAARGLRSSRRVTGRFTTSSTRGVESPGAVRSFCQARP
ncbi:MAG: hypothetical protein MZU79_01825 [Anaerotruncus sp.]|nr:hypothetical protein [Anaerotruncus sp.]